MRPAVFQVGGVVYWVLHTRNPDTGVLKDADSTPEVAVRKNGSSVADSVTVTKRSATTGIYDCSYNPAAEAEGDSFTLEESATVTGTTTSSATYAFAWNVRCVAVERGTDGAVQPLVAGRQLSVAATTGAVELDSATAQTLEDLADMIEGSGTVDVKFTGSALENGPSGGGGGSATLEKQEEILGAIETYASSMLATVDGSAATIVGFPETLVIGDSYTTDGSNAIHVFVRDGNDDPVTAVGTHEFTDSDFAPEVIITTSGRAGRVRASVTWVPGGSEGYLKIQIPLSESHRAAPGAATVQVVLKWVGCEKTIATQTVTWIPRI